MYYKKIATPIGYLFVSANDNYLLTVDSKEPELSIEGENEIIRETEKQLQLYFKGELRCFNLPIKITGSEFRQSVLKGILEIPYGTMLSYKDLAHMVNNPSAYRAAASVCASNQHLIIIPCHRVVKSDGTLGNYKLQGEYKEYLIKIESA